MQVAGRLCMRAPVDAHNKIHGISAATGREATPKISFEVHPEGCGIVPSVEGAGACELIASYPEMRIESVGGKDLPHGDTGLEEAKAMGMHFFLLFLSGCGRIG
ncbi:MAG: hypothetical protein A2289_01450 [Deltaproteobacteria bacterium RIFOXYA12_FULL_58_15]|nr:MAG: hypothetical protein A2289_01450 [Deltaproteobacteria bacterium RIFOXYA12_FULL_58_15]